MITFEHIETHTMLQSHFKLLEEGCERISRRNGFETFAPDIYHSLLLGKTMLVVGYRDGVVKGFFVYYTVEPPIGPSQMHVWLGYIRPGDPADGILAAFQEIEKTAKMHGCSQICFSTRRRGWEKVMKRVGMRVREITYFKGI